MKQRRILAAVDGSSYSRHILDKAIEFARLLEAEIILVYCHRRYPRLLGQPYRDQHISAIMDETEEVMGPSLSQLRESGVTFVERFMEEPAGEMIPMVAEREQCELIVMGSRGLSDLEGLIVGSVTHKVLHLAKCPVLVVK